MITLTATQTAAQIAASKKVLCKVAFTKTGEDTLTYYLGSGTNRVLRIVYTIREFSDVSSIIIDNRDGNLTDLDLRGYTATISYGYNTSEGDEYTARAPMEVISQYIPTDFSSPERYAQFTAIGKMDFMAFAKAATDYNQDDVTSATWEASTAYVVGDYVVPTTPNGYVYECTVAGTSHTGEPTWPTTPDGVVVDNTVTWSCSLAGSTVKVLMTELVDSGFFYSTFESLTITFDSEDNLVDSFVPGSYFKLQFQESRLSAYSTMQAYTKEKSRMEDDNEIHVFYPRVYGDTWVADTAYVKGDFVTPTTENDYTYECTTAGTSNSTEPTWGTTEAGTTNDNTVVWTCRSYHYEYNDTTGHNFWRKGVRKRLVNPNKITVQTPPDASTPYSGSAIDTDSYTALGRYITHRVRANVSSNAEAEDVALALMQEQKLSHDKGTFYAPINCGQEIFDLVKITDSATGDTLTGNISYLKFTVEPGKFEMEFDLGTPTSEVNLPPFTGPTTSEYLWEAYNSLSSTIDQIIDQQGAIVKYLDYVDKSYIEGLIRHTFYRDIDTSSLHITDLYAAATDQVASRSSGTVYQNATGSLMLVIIYAAFDASGGTASLLTYSQAANPPTVVHGSVVINDANVTDDGHTVVVFVPNGHNYKAVATNATIGLWIEALIA